MDFSSLVLYSYTDATRTELNPIDWKVCKSFEFSKIKESLTSNTLTEFISASEVFMQLGLGNIGTQDSKLIKEIVSPSIHQNLEIRIYWKKVSPDDGKRINLSQFHKQIEQEQLRIKQSY